MSFLNRSVLQERAAAAMVEKHPLLKECDVPTNVKQAYLQGCVLAVLERDDGKVTDAARQEITRLGLSLVMSNEDISEAISIVSGLNSPEAQDSFLGELASVLSGDVYVRYFMKDFELLMSKNGSLSESASQTLEYIGLTLAGKVDWRSDEKISPDQEIAVGVTNSSAATLPSNGRMQNFISKVRNIQIQHAGRVRSLGELVRDEEFQIKDGAVEIVNENVALSLKILEAVRLSRNLTVSYYKRPRILVRACEDKDRVRPMRDSGIFEDHRILDFVKRFCARCEDFGVKNDECRCERRAIVETIEGISTDRSKCPYYRSFPY